ncbi:MAG: 30S ribosomal protein S13 [archaeon]|jgi:small subunit ribosomal protein S13
MSKKDNAANAPMHKIVKKSDKSDGATRGSSDKLKLMKPKPKPSHFNPGKEGAEFKHIVRISNRDIPGYVTVAEGVSLIYGIGQRLSKAVEEIFFKDAGKVVKKVGNLEDKDIVMIEDIIQTLDKRVPAWMLNRPKQVDGKEAQYTMADLKLVERKELQRLGKMKSYRGLRLQWGLRVRGQKTRSSGRSHTTVGVTKKK